MNSRVLKKYFKDGKPSEEFLRRSPRYQRLAARGVHRYALLALPEKERLGPSKIHEFLRDAGTANPTVKGKRS